MIINGHEYTDLEVFEALTEKGYKIIPHTYILTDATFPGGYEDFEIETYCAIKDDEECTWQNDYKNVALKEFQHFTKPPLV